MQESNTMVRSSRTSSHTPSNSMNPSIQASTEMSEDTEIESENVEKSLHKDNKRSDVWKHFVVETQTDGTSKATCKYCAKLLVCKRNSGTSHLNRHTKFSCKKNPHKDIEHMLGKSPRSDGVIFSFDPEVSRKCLAKLVICAELPFKVVEHPLFIDFVKSLQPLFTVVGRHTIRSDCIALYQEEKGKLQIFLKNLDCRVSFTSDLWTSNQKLGYLVLTAHYIDDDFVLNKLILNFKKVPYPHTSYALNDVLGSCLAEWNVDEKVFSITLDNCSTNDALVRNFKRDFGEKLLFNGEHIHMRCCAHILNIMVQDGIKVMDNSVKCIRNLITYVVSSPSRMQIFNGVAQSFKLPTRKGLVLDVPTRWNSTYQMLTNALSYKDAFIRYAQLHYNDGPSLDDWKKVELVTNFLQIFVDTTEAFSGSKYPTSNLYFRKVWTIRRVLKEESAYGDDVVKILALEMQKKFNKYWEESNIMLSIASVLDPRSKLAYIEYTYERALGEEMSKMKGEEITTLLKKIYGEYERVVKQKAVVMDESSRLTSGDSTTTLTSLGKRKADSDFADFWAQSSLKRAKKNEVDSYLEEEVLPPMSDTDFSVLEWWKKNATLYPVLSKIARDILAIPVTTVSSESAFSTGSRVVDQHRSRLSPSTIEALICTQDWLRKDYYIDDGVDSSSLYNLTNDEELIGECLAE